MTRRRGIPDGKAVLMTRQSTDRSLLGPNQVLLLACARRELKPFHLRQIQAACARGVSWDALTDLAQAHGIGYFVSHHLRQLAGANFLPLPEAFLRRLQENARQMAAHALVLLHYQGRLAEAWERAGIPILWLKGLALSDQLYGRCEARQAGDLDVLVDPAYLARAEEDIRHLGLERWGHATPGLDGHPASAHHRVWCGNVINDWTLSVELHHRLSGPPLCQPPPADLLRRSRVMSLQGRPMRVPGREDELLILCLHAHQHHFACLRSLMDVAEYVQRFGSELDWRLILTRASRYRCRGRVSAALLLADRVLGFRQPSDGLPRRLPLTVIQRWAVRDLSRAALLEAEAQTDRFRQLRLALLMDHWRDVVELVLPHVVPPTSYLRAICPQPWARWPGLAHFWYLAWVGRQLVRDAWRKGWTAAHTSPKRR